MAKFTGTGGKDALNGTLFGDYIAGLGGNDTLQGSDGPDTLEGGAGIDSLVGGNGNDTFVIDATKDVIVDSSGSADRVRASISVDLNLSRFDGIEHATLTGTSALKITGDAGNNFLIGNSGANVLDGGTGQDTMFGGGGNDTYIVDNSLDIAIEWPGGGIDTVISKADYDISDQIENLILLSGADGFGNKLANKIIGDDSANLIAGRPGNDTLVGGGGNDTLAGEDDNDSLLGGLNQDLLNGGNGNDRISGDAGQDTLIGDSGNDTMIGGAGNDLYLIEDVGDKVSEAAGAIAGTADKVSSIISYTLGANIELLVLTGGDNIAGTGNGAGNSITGNSGNNTLQGGAGNDTIDGAAGDDAVFGGLGDDEIHASAGADTLVGGAGKDTYRATAAAGVPADDIMDFEMGVDRIDLTTGLTGYTGANLADYVKTSVLGGNTIVSIDFDGAGVLGFQETFRLVGIATDLDGLFAQGSLVLNPMPPLGLAPPTGGAGNDTLTGLAQSELIRGLGGNDSLTGDFGFDTLDGGTGADTMVGGNGSDTYVVDNAKDVITESSGADDRIRAAVSIDLTKYTGVEHATLTGTGALKATGDAAANMLIGNSGANILDGGSSTDTMIGGAGNDTYLADFTESSTVLENANEGIDTVIASGDFTLGANIENLILAPPTGIIVPLNRSATGNDLANKITGNSQFNDIQGLGGNDTLDGGKGNDTLNGGTGADRMFGSAGADTYVVDNAGDKITEMASADIDSVVSFISYTLGANLENLTLAGVFDINATGNAAKNSIVGSDGSNVLLGLGGDDTLDGDMLDDFVSGGDGNDVIFASVGADSLLGGAGKDSYKAEQSAAVGPADKIFDFETGADTIDLTGVLTGLTGSNLADYVQTAIVNGNTIVSIDFDGVGGAQPVFELVGIGTDVTGLRLNGSLAIDVATALPAQPAGTAAGETLAGTAASNLLLGLGGNDTLLGGDGTNTLDGGAGNDSMEGGVGNDTYVVNAAGDVILDTAGSNDRIRATIAIDLTQSKYDGIEHVTLIGAATLAAKGDEFGNQLVGNNAANKLDGGLGADTLIGGLGNDLYLVSDAADLIFELPGGGIDSVVSMAFDYVLGTGVEILTIAPGGFMGSGNELNNKITGNAIANPLNGAGGNDTINGGVGDDSLSGQDGNDILIGGVDDDTLVGGDGNDILIGGIGDDSLDGGTGNDVMNGGAGNDKYRVDSMSDKITDSGGTDLVNSALDSYTLGNGLENLTLVGTANSGTGNAGNNQINGTGGFNTLSGLAGNDLLLGGGGEDLLMGGTGNDTMFGGKDADTLVGGAGLDLFGITSDSLNAADIIADFQMGAGGDVLAIGNGIIGTEAERAVVANYVQTVESGGNTIVRIDIDGLGAGSGFVDAYVLQGVNTDVEGLITGDNISTQPF